MFEFTGRERELDILRSAWDKALQGEAQWVSIYAESGIGKTRLVQEFYHYFVETSINISSDSTVKRYWPDRLPSDNHDLKLNPDISLFSNDTISALDDLPSLWWGVRCPEKGRRNSTNISSAIYDHLPQLLPHLAILKSISARQDNYKSVAVDLGKKAISMATGGLVDFGIMLYELCENLDTLSKNTYSTNSHTAYEQQRIELSESLLKACHMIRRKQVPFLLVVDDIQFIDSETLTFVEALLKSNHQKLLIISTCWAREWHSHPLAKSIGNFSGEFYELELSTVESDNVDTIIQNTLPGLSERNRTTIATRCDRNLQYLYEICSLLKESPEEFFIDECPYNDFLSGAEETLLSERFDIETLIRKRFQALPQNVKELLIVGSFQGQKFSSALLENYPTTKHLDIEVSDCSDLLKLAINPGHFVKYEREFLYEFSQRSYWEITNKRLENSNNRSSIIDYYTDQASEIEQLDVDATSKLNLIYAVLPHLSLEKQFKLSLYACHLLVGMGRFRDTLTYYSEADTIIRKLALQGDYELQELISDKVAQSLYQIISYFPLYIKSNQHVAEEFRSNKGLTDFIPFRLIPFDLTNAYPEHELELIRYLDHAYIDVQSSRQLGHTLDEHQRIEAYLIAQKHVFDNHKKIVTSDMLFRYLLTICRNIYLEILFIRDLAGWKRFHAWLNEEHQHLITVIKSEVFNDNPYSVQHLLTLSIYAIQMSVLAWAQKSWQYYGKDVPISDNYNVYCAVADFVADSFHFEFLRSGDACQPQNLSSDNLALLANIEDEIHFVAAMYNYPLARDFSLRVLERIEKLFKGELTVTPEIIVGVTNTMIGIINNLEFGKKQREQSVSQETYKHETSEQKPILIIEEELQTERILDISKKLHAYLSRIIEEHRQTVDILIIICRLEHQILDMQNAILTEEPKLAWFEKTFHYAQLANDADLLVHGEVAPFINFLASEHNKFPRNSEAYDHIDQIGLAVYGESWDKFKVAAGN